MLIFLSCPACSIRSVQVVGPWVLLLSSNSCAIFFWKWLWWDALTMSGSTIKVSIFLRLASSTISFGAIPWNTWAWCCNVHLLSTDSTDDLSYSHYLFILHTYSNVRDLWSGSGRCQSQSEAHRGSNATKYSWSFTEGLAYTYFWSYCFRSCCSVLILVYHGLCGTPGVLPNR